MSDKERGLTPGEIDLAKGVFGDSIDYSQVRIHRGKVPGLLESHFQPDDCPVPANGRDIYFPDKIYKDDLSASNKGDFIHLMAYVWQFQEKIEDPGAVKKWLIKNSGDAEKAMQVTVDPSKDLKDYNIEQRARLIEDLYYMRDRMAHPEKPQHADPDGSRFLKEHGDYIKAHPTEWIVKMTVNALGITTGADGALHLDKNKWTQSLVRQHQAEEDQKKDDAAKLKILSQFVADPRYLEPGHKPTAPATTKPKAPGRSPG